MPDPEIVNDAPEKIEQKEEVVKQEPVKDEAKAEPDEETPEQINWKKFREAREKERKEKVAAEKRAQEKAEEAEALKKAMEALLDKPQKVQKPVDDWDTPDEDDDEKFKKRVAEIIAERDKIQEENRRKEEFAKLPTLLAQTYSDFNEICSTENLDYFEYHHPETAKAFKYMPDSFEKWSDIYKAVKRYMPSAGSKRDKERIEANANKPQSMSSAGMSTTGDTVPKFLDEKRRAANWDRMRRVIKGA